LDRHQSLLCFCRVVETGSFAAAARDLDVARSVVTRTIQDLEDWTASRLLERTTRAMQVTPAGERFYAYCRRVLQDTEQTLSSLRSARSEPSGRITVSTPVSLTLSFLADHLLAFQQQHPSVELDLRLSDRPADLIREGIDVALRGRAQLDDSSLVAVPLLTMRRVVCAAPAYWQVHGRPVHPRDLATHNCLAYLLGTDASRWTFDGVDGRHAIDVRGTLRADSSLFLIEALRRGLGVGLVPEPMVRRPIAQGTLQAVLEDYTVEPRTLFAVYPGREHQPERVRLFVRFLKDRLAT
jgi:DNA-binding transcriptional LysR family regulator